MKRIVFILISVLISVNIFAQQTDSWTDEDQNIFIWAVLEDYSPNMIYNEATGEYSGFMYELINNILQDLNIPNQVVHDSFQNIYSKILSGEIYLFPSLLQTEERMETIYWPENKEPIMVGWGSFFVAQDVSIESVTDLKGQDIGVMAGDANGYLFIKFLKEFDIYVNIKEYESFQSLIDAITSGEVIGGAAFSSLGLNHPKIKKTPIVFAPTSSYATGGVEAPDWAKVYIDEIQECLADLKENPNSYFYDLQRKYLLSETIKSYVFPTWVWIIIFSIVGIVVILFFWTKILRKVVKIKTEELNKLNKTLEQKIYERAKQLEETTDVLIRSEKQASLGRMVAGIAHEINTPIGVALTAASFLNDKAKTIHDKYADSTLTELDFNNMMEENVNLTQLINNNITRAAELIRSLKEMSIDQAFDNIRRINIPGYTDVVMNTLKPKLKHTNYTYNFDIQNYDAVFNPSYYAQFITNLIINSIDHGFEGRKDGHIFMSIKIDEDGYITHIYEDNGCGIDEEHIDKIFEPFYTTKRGRGFIGLGCNVIYNIAHEFFGGDIKVENRREGGVRFTLKFKPKFEIFIN